MILIPCLIVGIGAIAIGLAALFQPAIASAIFGVKASGDETHYVRVTGARDIFIGLIFLYFYFESNQRALGFICLFVSVVSFCDFLVVFFKGMRVISYSHLAATLAAIAYGLWILR